MKDLLKLVKHLLEITVKGAAAFVILFLSPLLVVMYAMAACLYFCAATVSFFLACLADDGNLSKFIFPRWSNKSKWIPQLKFD